MTYKGLEVKFNARDYKYSWQKFKLYYMLLNKLWSDFRFGGLMISFTIAIHTMCFANKFVHFTIQINAFHLGIMLTFVKRN